MALEEIKSVRVRRSDNTSDSLDIKVTLYKESRKEVVVVGTNNGKVVWYGVTYPKKGFFKDFTDNDFILNYIKDPLLAYTSGNPYAVKEDKKYTIIQDPWEPTYPKYRNFGFDPYYLSNGAEVILSWFDKDNPLTRFGGTTYSTIDGEEIIVKDYVIRKSFSIIHPDSPVITLNKNNVFESTISSKDYENLMDKFILDEIIQKWNAKIPNYGLTLCSPNNEKCSFIPFKSPLDADIKKDIKESTDKELAPPKVVDNEPPKEKMNVVLPTDVVKAKVDITSLKVYIGAPKEILEKQNNNPDTQSDDYIYSDEENDILSGYGEEPFSGDDETKWEPIVDAPDDTFDPDNDKGGDDSTTPASFAPATQTQKDFIKSAVNATLSKGEQHGKCARFTFNHANNYVRLLQGKSVERGSVYSAGGNANSTGYHKNLQSIGYKIVRNEEISKSSLISKINTTAWSVGDIIAYWCTDGSSSASHVQYGHTQVFTNGFHNNSSYRWSTDNQNNYNSSFVYRNKSGNTYKFIHFEAPKTKRINDSV